MKKNKMKAILFFAFLLTLPLWMYVPMTILTRGSWLITGLAYGECVLIEVILFFKLITERYSHVSPIPFSRTETALKTFRRLVMIVLPFAAVAIRLIIGAGTIAFTGLIVTLYLEPIIYICHQRVTLSHLREAVQHGKSIEAVGGPSHD